jgi:hypothetical protein
MYVIKHGNKIIIDGYLISIFGLMHSYYLNIKLKKLLRIIYEEI